MAEIYKCLNPVGMVAPVEMSPLAPRLNALDGKTIYISLTYDRPVIDPLENQLRRGYPNVNWKTKKTLGLAPIQLSDEEMKTADGLIQAVCW